MKNILVAGGYHVAHVLVPRLLESGYKVRYYDQFFFGKDSFLSNNANLEIIDADLRDSASFSNACKGMDVVLWLSDIDSINYKELAYASGVKKVINHTEHAHLTSSTNRLILSGSERQPMITSDYKAYLVASKLSPILVPQQMMINGYSPRTKLSITELKETNGNTEQKPLIKKGFLL